MIARVLFTAALGFTQVAPGTGRVVGTVTLTTATSGKSPARAYDSRSVAPRTKPLPESRNVVIFFDGVAASTDLGHKRDTLAQKEDRKTTRLNSRHSYISYAVFCL